MKALFTHPLLWLAAILLTLTGCATKVEYRDVIVEKVKTLVIAPPDHLMADCRITQPPGKDYITKSYPEKETILVNFAAQQTLNLGECNKDKAALRKWKSDQSEIGAK